LAAADHLQVPRQHGLFNHHGIDLGDGSVAHFLEGREILRSPLAEFSQGQPLTVIEHNNASPPRVTLQRALSRIGEQNYNLLFNNCEHFATWCKTGRHRSDQVNSVSERARHWSGLMPSAVMSGLELLIEHGLLDDRSRAIALKGVERLEQLRRKLINRLEELLQQDNSASNKKLLLTGQCLADQLSEVEELKSKVDNLLRQDQKTPKAMENN